MSISEKVAFLRPLINILRRKLDTLSIVYMYIIIYQFTVVIYTAQKHEEKNIF